MSSLLYFVKEGLKGIRANSGTAAGSIITIFLSLFLIGVFVFADHVIDGVTSAVEDQVAITAYIADDYAEDPGAYEPVMSDIEAIDGVSQVSFTSKDEALSEFQATMSGDNDDIVTQLDGINPLPASFTISLSDPQKVEDIASEIQSMDSFTSICDDPENPKNSVKYGQRTVEKLFSVTDAVRLAGTALVALLIVVAFIFMNSTIRLAVLNRQQEISIERLVGASNGFIRGPFFAEGIIHAVIGALLAIVALEILCAVAVPRLATSMAWLAIDIPTDFRIQTYCFLMIAGIVIGLVSSAMAMRKYLKV